MNELTSKLGIRRLRLQGFDFDVTYRPVIVNRAAVSRIDSQSNFGTPIDDEVSTMAMSINPGPSDDDAVEEEEDLLSTGE